MSKNNLTLVAISLLLVVAHIFIVSNKTYTIPGTNASFKDPQVYQEFLYGFNEQTRLVFAQDTKINYAGLPGWTPNIFFVGYLLLIIIFIRSNLKNNSL